MLIFLSFKIKGLLDLLMYQLLVWAQEVAQHAVVKNRQKNVNNNICKQRHYLYLLNVIKVVHENQQKKLESLQKDSLNHLKLEMGSMINFTKREETMKR